MRLYLAGKGDKERFRRRYYAEISERVYRRDSEEEGRNRLGTPYRALRKVYDEWENREN